MSVARAQVPLVLAAAPRLAHVLAGAPLLLPQPVTLALQQLLSCWRAGGAAHPDAPCRRAAASLTQHRTRITVPHIHTQYTLAYLYIDCLA
ncbi:hypothetical protein K1T71_011549 [Dendrolimus kikuchii]|uniref:Uncharacterized protein n=1 Tax=Dendrolimus kikuchii TaxID=765133 RepID=A0ACC1CP39_9NEOP|nr:hypothetical protein K1T71_011549 [Dendrolimus kikuchii]